MTDSIPEHPFLNTTCHFLIQSITSNCIHPFSLSQYPARKQTALFAATLCGRLGEALRSSTYVDFREGPLTLRYTSPGPRPPWLNLSILFITKMAPAPLATNPRRLLAGVPILAHPSIFYRFVRINFGRYPSFSSSCIICCLCSVPNASIVILSSTAAFLFVL